MSITENAATEITRQRFEKFYQKAMRDVDISENRTKNAGKEYEIKAKEMHELGDYRNALSLAVQYEKYAEVYLSAEENEKKRKKKFDFYKIVLSFLRLFRVYLL